MVPMPAAAHSRKPPNQRLPIAAVASESVPLLRVT